MAGRSAVLKVVIAGDASGASKAMADTASAADKMQAGMQKAGAVAAGAMAATAAGAAKAVGAASDLQQSMGAVESVFGAASGTIEAFADTAAQSVGLSAREFNELASVSGAMLQNLGYSADEAAQKTIDLSKRAADLAAVFGGPASQAMDAMNAALRGEYDSLEQYGVKLSESAVQQAALTATHKTAASQLTANEKAQAALNLIMQQSAAAAGQFQGESNTLAVQQQQLKASFEDTAAQLGTVLLPYFTQFVGWLQQAVTWVSENQATVQALVVGIGGLAAAVLGINAAMSTWKAVSEAWTNVTKVADGVQKLFKTGTEASTVATLAQKAATIASSTATKTWTAIQKAFNLVMEANPIMLVVTAIAALIAIVIKAYQESETFRAIVDKLWQLLQNTLGAAINIVVGAFQAMVNIIKAVWDWMGKLISKAKELISALNPFNHISLPWNNDRSASNRSARSAPTLRSGQSRAASSPAPVTVNVSGALDPESVARQIRSILDGHEIRQGRTVARAMAW
jgi:hypothetical protein